MQANRWVWFLTVIVLWLSSTATAAELPKMQFNDVKEIAPGVWFRYSSISATDDKVVFGGSNNIWVIFEDYVVVIDANFPKEAGDVIAAVKKTTDKPIRYVFDTHHHGDHAYGNAVFAKEGASIIAQTKCAAWLREKGLKEFEEAGKPPKGRPDVHDSKLKVPNVVFDDKLVLDDGKQRVEFLYFGHGHTPGDACAYLPKHKILCTGDACVNGAFNYMGHSDSASWVRALERMQQLDIEMICPGHGPVAAKDLLEKQKRYFVALREEMQKSIDAGKDLKEITKTIDFPWYKEWTGVPVSSREENLQHVYDELTGRITPWDLIEDYSVYEGKSPTKETPGWKAPRRIVVPDLMPARLAELKRVAPLVEFIPAKTLEDAVRLAGDADAVVGFCSADLVKAGKNLRWIQVGHAGVDQDLSPELIQSQIVLTNIQRLHGPQVADQTFALLLGLTRGLERAVHGDEREKQSKVVPRWDWLKQEIKPRELNGKTMLVVGLGGVGTEVARRAHAFGMRVMALDPRDLERPSFVFSLAKPDQLAVLLPQADVVVLACPLTKQTRGLIGPYEFYLMKPWAYFINVSHGGLVKMPALLDVVQKKRLAGVGLDVIDPEPLPDDSPLWKAGNVLISPHSGEQSPEGVERQWRLWRENIRRFVAGEPLLCVVDKEKGF